MQKQERLKMNAYEGTITFHRCWPDPGGVRLNLDLLVEDDRKSQPECFIRFQIELLRGLTGTPNFRFLHSIYFKKYKMGVLFPFLSLSTFPALP